MPVPRPAAAVPKFTYPVNPMMMLRLEARATNISTVNAVSRRVLTMAGAATPVASVLQFWLAPQVPPAVPKLVVVPLLSQ